MPRNPLQKNGWQLTFEDDFDSGIIDANKWRVSISFIGPYSDKHLHKYDDADFANGQFPERYYSPNFIFGPSTVKLIADNTPIKITIPPAPQKWSGDFWVPYTVQALQWVDDPYLLEQRHGYFEIRCKSQDAKDMWPAFWLYPISPPNGPYKAGGAELDVTEFMSRKPDIFTTTQHWGVNPSKSESKRHRACQAGKRFHIYACEWNDKTISWYLDNKLLRTTSKGIGSFIYKMSVIVNTGIDERDCRRPKKSKYPNYLEVDYIRVYSR